MEADSGVYANLRWVKLRGNEALRRSREMFKQASSLQGVLVLGAITGKEAQDMEVRGLGSYGREAKGLGIES